MLAVSDLFLTHMSLWTILLRLGAACLLGFLIGLDREVRGHPAGLRTHMLVALAAATFTLVAFEITAAFEAADNVQIDPLRVVEAITAGVAFLAAGTIIQARGKVKGLTTGAGMWLAGAIGLACGAGFLALAMICTGLVLLILRPMHWIERRLDHGSPREPSEPGARSAKEGD